MKSRWTAAGTVAASTVKIVVSLCNVATAFMILLGVLAGRLNTLEACAMATVVFGSFKLLEVLDGRPPVKRQPEA